MAGLFDFLQPQQGGSGLLGNMGGWLGNNQDALIAMGLGLAGGATPMEGFKGGMQGYLSGRASDQSRVAGEGFLKELGLGVAPSAGPFSKPTPAMPGMAPAGMPGVPPMAPGASPPISNYGNAIAGIESRGQANPYAAVGPDNGKGQRPYGKYQVMDFNIGPWTQEVLGQPMTPQQFAGSPDAQEAVFKAKFGQYVQQTGNPQDAASMWFTGKPLAQGANRADVNGVTGQQYVNKFNAGLPQQPVQVAQAGGGPTPMPAQAAPAGPAQAVPQDALGRIRQMPIETVMRWAMNPNLKGPQAEVAKELFKARLADTAMTDGQKDYLVAKVGGFTGSFADFKNQPKLEDTGQRDQFGRPLPKAWVNSNDQSVKPLAASVTSGPSGAGGANPPIELVTDLRKQVQAIPSYKALTAAQPVYTSMLKSVSINSKASDVDLIFGLGKLLDPDSVVRDGDQLAVKKTASLPDFVLGAVNSLNGGAALTPETRKAIMDIAYNRVSSYKESFDRDAAQYHELVTDYKIKPSHVLPDFGWVHEYVSQKTTAPPPGMFANPEQPRTQGGPTSNPYEAEARRRGLIK